MDRKQIAAMREEDFAWLLVEKIADIEIVADAISKREFWKGDVHIEWTVKMGFWNIQIDNYGKRHWKTRVFNLDSGAWLNKGERIGLWEDLEGRFWLLPTN